MRYYASKTFSFIIKTIVIVLVFLLFDVNGRKTELKVENVNLNKTLDLKTMAQVADNIVITDLHMPLDTYTGSLTGYAADCPLCSGSLGCPPYMNVMDRRTTYLDSTFGEVKIVASSRNLPCGSIIAFNSSRIADKTIIAIVLDRGVGGTNIDLLTESEDYARLIIGRSTITYDVLRFGWGSE